MNDKYLYHYCSTLPRAQLFLWTPSAQQNLVVQSSPPVQSHQGDLDYLWHPGHGLQDSRSQLIPRREILVNSEFCVHF